jgi:L-threonylcarbamoyladenylate synthase
VTLDALDAARLQDCVARGGVVVFPTDTVYGVGCDPENLSAVKRLYELKGRPAERPAAVMFFRLQSALDALPELGERERLALRALLPGPVTVLLPNRRRRFPLACRPGADESGAEGRPGADEPGTDGGPGADAAPGAEGGDSLGLRVPRLEGELAALGSVSVALLQSSANLSGEGEACELGAVPERLRAGADFALDGGELPGVASTVLDLRSYEADGEWRVLRQGPVDPELLRRALAQAES